MPLSKSITGANFADFAVTGGTWRVNVGGWRCLMHLHREVHAEHRRLGERDARRQRLRRRSQPAQPDADRHRQLVGVGVANL